MIDFTYRKFLRLPVERQHRNCAKLLREMYERLLQGDRETELREIYYKLLSWMKLEEMRTGTLEEISLAYHNHLTQANERLKEDNLLPEVRCGDRSSGEEVWDIAIYLDNLRSAHNVGSILRTVEAFGLGSVYFGGQTPFIDNKQVQSTSKSCYDWVLCRRFLDWQNMPKPVIVLETAANAVPLDEFLFPETFTLVLGNEEFGCSSEAMKQGDLFIEIPLRGRKNSLNVANAFAITAAEIARQKARKQKNESF